MSHRRAPLSDIPNAANSPYRAVAAATSKRSRLDAGLQEDPKYDRQPSAKRQALELRASNTRTPPPKQALTTGEDRLFNKKAQNRKPTAFERKLLAARDGHQLEKTEKQEKVTGEEGIRSWQKHYRRLFPSFVFYFESIPDDVRLRCSRQIRALGAREEKFFSKEVTHIVTTRPVPSDSDSPTDVDTSSSKNLSSQATQTRTINPSLLDKQAEPPAVSTSTKFSFDAVVGRKTKGLVRGFPEAEFKKPSLGSTDILQRAHGMGIKIWQLEKLNRILDSMNGGLSDAQAQPSRIGRGLAAAKASREADLSHMLRNEQLNGPSDRDQTASSGEIVPFRGFYMYIRDMDERTKPILLKEYAKIPRGEDGSWEAGDWPQFRANSSGKCPFVEDPYAARQELERTNHRSRDERAKARAESRPPPRTRGETAQARAAADQRLEAPERTPLMESKNAGNRTVTTKPQLPPQDFCPPPPPIGKRSPAKSSRAAPCVQPTKLFGGEPAASGLQQSNITSAIRSQMISSTAAAPGAKAGTSKEVHGLKRKVLERNAPSLQGRQIVPQSRIITGPARAEQAIPVTRQARRRAQERLIHIEEESTQSEEEDVWQEEARRTHAVESKPTKAKDPKPGYCENCREKYDDFDDHIISRKHRKFAMTSDNWKDLDKLLSQLGRPIRENMPEYSSDENLAPEDDEEDDEDDDEDEDEDEEGEEQEEDVC